MSDKLQFKLRERPTTEDERGRFAEEIAAFGMNAGAWRSAIEQAERACEAFARNFAPAVEALCLMVEQRERLCESIRRAALCDFASVAQSAAAIRAGLAAAAAMPKVTIPALSPEAVAALHYVAASRAAVTDAVARHTFPADIRPARPRVDVVIVVIKAEGEM